MLLPEPGGPMKITLCPPAAAISSARLAAACPLTSAKSGMPSQSGSRKTAPPLFESGRSSPERARMASVREFTAYTRMCGSTVAASRAFAAGTISVRMFGICFASSAAGRTPLTARTELSSASSPRIMASSSVSFGNAPAAEASASAIGRSNAVPSFRISPGARFTSVKPSGCRSPAA